MAISKRQEFWVDAANEAAAKNIDVAAGLFALLAQPTEAEKRRQAKPPIHPDARLPMSEHPLFEDA